MTKTLSFLFLFSFCAFLTADDYAYIVCHGKGFDQVKKQDIIYVNTPQKMNLSDIDKHAAIKTDKGWDVFQDLRYHRLSLGGTSYFSFKDKKEALKKYDQIVEGAKKRGLEVRETSIKLTGTHVVKGVKYKFR